MHVPTDRPLREWVLELIRDGKLYKFYKTFEWQSLRAEVMADHHNECEMCYELGAYRQDGRGRWRRDTNERYTRADTVHHEYEVKQHPSMALTRYVTEPDGSLREVLHTLCNRCHNDIHGRTWKGTKPKPPINEERWD
jgi:hypothetical protein